MSGFDHDAHAAAVAGAIEYVAGGRTLAWRGRSFPVLIESVPPRLAPAFDRQPGNDVVAVVTIARALFAAKQVPVPGAGDTLLAADGTRYRIQRPEGAPTDAEARFTCSVSKPA